MDKAEINSLKRGDKLFFYKYGGVLSTSKGNVFTFSKWYDNNGKDSPSKYHWQCEELIALGNNVHNFSIFDVELFDKTKHKKYKIMTPSKLKEEERAFIEKFG